jgi:methylated-DNA-[protein]-cysteine S-methyltransferase
MTTSLTVASPIGKLVAVAEGDNLVELLLPNRAAGVTAPATTRSAVLAATARQLAEYFAGTRRVFDLPLVPRGTDFQTRVWLELLAIPYGETCSYADIARAVGRPSASRAVGAANGANPIAIIVPCHRVIGADRSLTGYGGGVPLKKWLLAHEGARQLRLVG